MQTERATAVIGDLQTLTTSWLRHLRAANLSPRTIKNYREAAEQLLEFLSATGMPTNAATIAREHVEAFITDVMTRTTPATAATRYRGLQQLFRWLAEEGEIAKSPMVRMRPPKVEEKPIPIVREHELRRLFATCLGSSFVDRRDAAVLRVFVNTGARLGEVAGLKIEDVDLDIGEIRLFRKGRREQWLPIREAPPVTSWIAD